MNTNDAVLEEYKTLREEILRIQHHRLMVLGFTVAGVGAIIGLTVRERETLTSFPFDYFDLSMLIFADILIMAAMVLTIYHTQMIVTIAGYIRQFVEKDVDGLNYETRWMDFRLAKKDKQIESGIPLGMSKALCVYYLMLDIAILSVTYPTGIYRVLPAFLIVIFFSILAVLISVDLFFQVTQGWKVRWGPTTDDQEPG